MGGAAAPTAPRRWIGILPILDWLPRYDRSWLRNDIIAGIAVTAMIVPKNLGYAEIAGVPVQNGLYAAAAGALIYALFCTSRHISTGPSSSLAAVAGGAVLVTGLVGADAAQLVAAITLVTGALFVLMAVLRLGWISRFLSRAVVTGFLAGAAIDVVIGELPKLTGTSADGSNAFTEVASWVTGLSETHVATLVVGLLALGGILGLRFLCAARSRRARAGGRRPGCVSCVRPGCGWRDTGRPGAERSAAASGALARAGAAPPARRSRSRHSRCCSSGSRRLPATRGHSRPAIAIGST